MQYKCELRNAMHYSLYNSHSKFLAVDLKSFRYYTIKIKVILVYDTKAL